MKTSVWVLTEGFDRNDNEPTCNARVIAVFTTREAAHRWITALRPSLKDFDHFIVDDYFEHAGGWYEIQAFEVQS